MFLNDLSGLTIGSTVVDESKNTVIPSATSFTASFARIRLLCAFTRTR